MLSIMGKFRNRQLSAKQRLKILDHVREGYTHSHIASIYGVSRARIGQIANADADAILEWTRIAELPDLEAKNTPDESND